MVRQHLRAKLRYSARPVFPVSVPSPPLERGHHKYEAHNAGGHAAERPQFGAFGSKYVAPPEAEESDKQPRD